ncbi:MAG TPA: redoxin domain-containing protein [Terriglobales bacterium]|nr:redoxin domain-containing protein [Terriglobales bacterium]
MPELDSKRAKFEGLNAQVVGISADSITSHIAWQKKEIGILSFPICADFYPHGAVTQQFGILRDGPPVPGIPERAAFVVDKAGLVRFAKVYPLDQVPDVDEILRAVAEAQ